MQRAHAKQGSEARDGTSLEELYLDLLKRALTRIDAPLDVPRDIQPVHAVSRAAHRLIRPLLKRRGIRLVRGRPLDPVGLEIGMRPHPDAETMIGLRRLDNIQELVLDAIDKGIPGDLVETGVWRGGATIFMRGILMAYGIQDRSVWVADSFQGLPPADAERFPVDAEHQWWGGDAWIMSNFAVPLEQVQANFARYGLLDDQVRFLQGWFRDTLPDAPIGEIAVLRLDGDLYESTMVALEALYPRLSPGGYVILDDYGVWETCKQATDDYRTANGIVDEIQWIDWTGVYWRKSRGTE